MKITVKREIETDDLSLADILILLKDEINQVIEQFDANFPIDTIELSTLDLLLAEAIERSTLDSIEKTKDDVFPTWHITSETRLNNGAPDPNPTVYKIQHDPDEVIPSWWTCDCKHFWFRQMICKHIRLAKAGSGHFDGYREPTNSTERLLIQQGDGS